MNIKKKFTLIKGTPNILNLSKGVIDAQNIKGDRVNIVRTIRLLENRVHNHYTYNQVSKLTNNMKTVRQRLHVVNLKEYPISISYNKPTKRIVINLSPFNVDEISKIEPFNVYALLVYGICFESFILGKKSIKSIYYAPITNWLTTVFVKVFGKEYGLLGPYTNEISKLKFLISCYILGSFFNITGLSAYKKSSTLSSVDYSKIKDNLKKYDFIKIEDFIKSLNELKVFPGFKIGYFLQKFYRFFGINFLPAIEDASRFISILATTSVTGSNIVPTFIGKSYNKVEYEKILEISKSVFK